MLADPKQVSKCHGQAGEGGLGPSLVLATGSCQTCGDDASLQKRISSTMPVGAVGTCTGDCAKSTARFIRYALNKGNAQDCTQLTSRMGQRQLRLLTQKEYHTTIRDLFGLEVLKAERFWPEAANVLGYNNNAEAALVTDRHLRVFVVLAHEISEQILPADRYRMVCQGDQRCTIAKLGLEVFRRPLAEAEILTYLKLWLENQGSSRTVLEAMLLSPRFLYRSELGSFVSPMGAYKLDSYELASAMSYTLVGTTPDQTLLDQAAKGNLLNASIRRQEAERLLESEAARQSFGDFALQWLGIGGLATLTRDNPL
ncbi:MAG: DUF1592 domain-containing protein, partial [Proteobacteria bacterium]|nr:DUF1592 domain-containing protein [Pseudomonadota bacterium]